MQRQQLVAVVRTALVLGLIIGLGAATWKMFQFHGRLAAIENPAWEQRLAAEQIYKHPIVMFGDSQIARWPVATSFGELPVIDRGVVGDFATESGTRYQREVLPLNPVLVVILIGTNDLAHGKSVEAILQSIEQMTAAARKQDAAVILCSVLPARGEAARIRPRASIEQLNAGLQALAHAQAASYVDLYSELLNGQGDLSESFSDDGLHPNSAGYIRMSKILLPRLLPYATSGSVGAVPPAKNAS